MVALILPINRFFTFSTSIVSTYVPQSTRIVHVGNSNHLSQTTTSVYWRVRRKLVFLGKCSFNKQLFYLLHRSLHLIFPSPLTLKLRTCVYSWTPNLRGAVVLHCISIFIQNLGNQKNNTQDTNFFLCHSTKWAQWC